MLEEIKDITIKELLNLWKSDEYEIEIDSEDGYVELINVFKQGVKECVSINKGMLKCSMSQLVETSRGWIEAGHLYIGDRLKVRAGWKRVISLEFIGKYRTYDVSVKHFNHRYYGNGVSIHNCYGGTAYTVSGNMKTTKEEAQEKIDNFFSKLITLNVYMIGAKQKVLEIGRVYNLFGRYRNMSKWAFSPNWKDKAYAQRTALNHPIQSTSAEILKIIMIRVDNYIETNGLSLLYGSGIPQKFDLNKVSYKNMILHELMSTHDEVDFLFNQDYIESLLPIIYEIMQIKDVMAAFNIGFDLELDCEYDKKFRSLVASEAYLNSKIFVINNLKQIQMVSEDKIEPNIVLIDLGDLNSDILNKLMKVSLEGGKYLIVISSEEGIYVHKNKISLEALKNLELKYQLAYMN